MTPAEWIGGAVALGTLIALAGRGLRSLLRSFHAEHIAPSIINVSHAIADNTKATSALTDALARTNEAQERGFNRLGDIIADHETRITVLELPQPKGSAKARPKRRAP
jgi:hypothetical protein